jgi:hypothetical protein
MYSLQASNAPRSPPSMRVLRAQGRRRTRLAPPYRTTSHLGSISRLVRAHVFVFEIIHTQIDIVADGRYVGRHFDTQTHGFRVDFLEYRDIEISEQKKKASVS